MKAKAVQYPAGVQIEITPKCNHNCIHCYNYWRTGEEAINEELGNMDEIAKRISHLYPTHLTITGGEPLLRFDVVKSIVKILKETTCTHISINTNASLVTDEIASFLHENNVSAFVSFPCGIPHICDEITTVKNSFFNISKGIETLVKHGVRVAINMVVSKINLNYIYETAQLAYETYGITSFYASPVSKPINSSNEFNKLLLSKQDINLLTDTLIQISDDLKINTEFSVSLPYCCFTTQRQSDRFSYKKNCTAGKFSYAVDFMGNVKACPRDNKQYGNILIDSFNIIWKKMEEWRDDSLLPNECKSCISNSVCSGGCRLERYAETNKRNLLDPRANLDYSPLKFKKAEFKYPYPDNYVFIVNPNLNAVIEDIGVRINVGTDFLYITPKFYKFLLQAKKVDLNLMLKFFPNANVKETKIIINQLIKMRVLLIK